MLSAILALGQHVDGVHAVQHQFSQSLEALTNRILSAPPPAPQTTQPTPAPQPSVTQDAFTNPSFPRGAPRFKEPFVFSGSAAEVEPWIDEVTNAVHLQRATLTTDFDKAIYIAGYLKVGNPKSWYYGIKSREDLLWNFEELIKNFRAHFGDSNLQATALRKLKSLKQTGPCAAYASRSRELHEHLDLDDFTKINYFYEGLKDGVKDLLLTIDRSDEFDAFVDQCVLLDNRLHERELERRQFSKGSSHRSQDSKPRASPPSFVSPAPSTSSQVVPMEIDAVKRGPISADEKARRKREGLCFYCGQGKHRVEDCPNMSEKAKTAFKARRNANSASSSGKA